MKIRILVLESVFDTGLTTLLDTLSTANELALASGAPNPPFDVQVIGFTRHVQTAMGLRVSTMPVQHTGSPDWIVVPALNAISRDTLLAALARDDVEAAKKRLLEWKNRGIGIAAACISTFVLADSGVLDGKDATTTWSLAPLFRERYPKVRLNDSRMIVNANGVVTAGAAMGHIDLALWFVRQVSPDLATMVAHLLLIDNRTSQAQYVVPDYLAHTDPIVDHFERWARKNLSKGFSLRDAADALHVHTRTLQRRTELVLGKSPLAFFQDLRIQQARQLLLDGLDLDTVAERVGYADASTVRKLLRRTLGISPREIKMKRM